MRDARSRSIDWIALALFISLMIIGWLMVYAASYDQARQLAPYDLSTSAGKQLLFAGTAFIAFALVTLIEVRFWQTFAYPIYGISLLSLVAVLFLGATIKGSTSWFAFGPLSLQPSEFAKFATSLALAAYLSHYQTDLRKFRYQAWALSLLAAPAILIMLQPDAGSALVFSSFLLLLYRQGMPTLLYLTGLVFLALFISAIVFPPMLVVAILLLFSAIILSVQLNNQFIWMSAFAALLVLEIILWELVIPLPVIGLNATLLLVATFRRTQSRFVRQVAFVLPAALICCSFVLGVNYSFERILEPHQQDRINVWLQPELCDPQGSLYNVLQSKIAIGSGGMIGKGYLEGSMTNLNYVPEQTTDFIFSTIGEEQGFIGSAGIIILFTFLLLRILAMAERMRSDFSRFFTYGVLGILFFHFFINIGMTMGLVPIIGIPLPFLSYGGSSLVAFAIMLGVVFKMDSSRYEV